MKLHLARIFSMENTMNECLPIASQHGDYLFRGFNIRTKTCVRVRFVDAVVLLVLLVFLLLLVLLSCLADLVSGCCFGCCCCCCCCCSCVVANIWIWFVSFKPPKNSNNKQEAQQCHEQQQNKHNNNKNNKKKIEQHRSKGGIVAMGNGPNTKEKPSKD